MLNHTIAEIFFDNSENDVALHSQRVIDQLTVDNQVFSSITIEVPPDGECGFTAVEYALKILGKHELASHVSRRGIITSVKQKMQEVLNSDDADNPVHQELKKFLIAIFVSSGLSGYEFSEETLARWEQGFNEWASDAHFSWLSYLYNIRFDFFMVDHESSTGFIPRIGVSNGGGHSIDFGEAEESEKITVYLAHVSTKKVDINVGEPNNHFDLLFVNPTEALKQIIRSENYIITQEKVARLESKNTVNKIYIPEIEYPEDKVSDIVKKITALPEENKADLDDALNHIQELYDVINAFLDSSSIENFLGQIRLSCEELDRLCWQVYKLTNMPQCLSLSYGLYDVLRGPIKNLQNCIDKYVTIGQAALLDNSVRTKTLYAEQSLVLGNAQYRAALDQHLRKLRVFSTPNSAVTREPCGERCFISYAWPLPQHLEDEKYLQSLLKIFREHLRLAGVQAILDVVDNHPGNSTYAYMNQIKNDFIILVLTESLRDKHNDPSVRAVHSELAMIDAKLSDDLKTFGPDKCRVFPWLISGELGFSNPPRYQMYSNVRDARDYHYLVNLKNIIRWIYFDALYYDSCDVKKHQLRDDYDKLWEDFFDNYREIIENKPDLNKESIFFIHENNISEIRGSKNYTSLSKEKGSNVFDVKKILNSQSRSVVPREFVARKENNAYSDVGVSQQLSKNIMSKSKDKALSIHSENFSMPLGSFTNDTKKRYALPNPAHQLLEMSFQGITGESSRRENSRLSFLNKIEHAFKDDSSVVLTDPKHYQRILLGNGGMGKTELAKVYARYCKIKKPHRYMLIWWIDATDKLEHQFALLLKEVFNLHPFSVSNKIDVVKWAYKNLEQVDHWLLVFDNVEDADCLMGYQPSDHSDVLDLSAPEKRRHYIVTTRHPAWPSQSVIELTGLTSDEIYDFAQQYNLSYDRNELLLLEQALHKHPLGIAHAFNYLSICVKNKIFLSIIEYINCLDGLSELSIAPHHPSPVEYGYEYYLKNALKAVFLSISLLEENFNIEGIPEDVSRLIIKKILCCFGYLKRTNIPYDLIKIILITFGQKESLAFIIIERLKEYYIIENSSHDSFTIHQIIQRCLQFTLLQDDTKETFDILLQVVNQKFDYNPKIQSRLNDHDYGKWIRQAESLLLVSHYDDLGSDLLRLELCAKLGIYFSFETRQYDRAFLWLTKAEKQLFQLGEASYSKEQKSDIYNAFAWSYLAQSQFELAEEYVLKIFKLHDYHFSHSCPNLECAQGLIAFFAIKGNSGDVLDQKLAENCLAFCKYFSGNKQSFAFVRVYAEAKLNQSVRFSRVELNYHSACELAEQAVRLYENAFPPYHPRALMVRRLLIQTWLMLNNIQQAQTTIAEAISFVDSDAKNFDRIMLRYYFIESCGKYMTLEEIDSIKEQIIDISSDNEFFMHEYDQQGYNIFHLAVINNHMELVELLLRCEIYAIYVRGLHDGCTAAHLAASKNHLEILIFLIEQGLDVNLQNKNNETALHFGVSNGFEKIVDVLLDNNAQPTIKNVFNDTPFHVAVLRQHTSIIKKILQREAGLVNLLGNRNLHVLLMVNGNEELATLLFDYGASFDFFSVSTYLFLKSFLASKKYDVVARWIARFPELLRDWGGNPLLLAIYWNNKDWAEFLYQHNNQLLHQVDENGYSAVLMASLCGVLKLLQWLVAQGADVLVVNKSGDNIVNLAVIGHSLDVLQWLLSQGLRESKNNFGLTASKIASLCKNIEMQHLLDAFSSNMTNEVLEVVLSQNTEDFSAVDSVLAYMQSCLIDKKFPWFSILSLLNSCYYYPLEWKVDAVQLSENIRASLKISRHTSLQGWHLVLQSKILEIEVLKDVIFRALNDQSIEIRLMAFSLWENFEGVLGVDEYYAACFENLLLHTDASVVFYIRNVLNLYRKKYANIHDLLVKNIDQYEVIVRYYGAKFGFHRISVPSFITTLINLKIFELFLQEFFLIFDDNLTISVDVHKEFSLHLTYDPSSERLYLYAPLLEGLPADKCLIIYEHLLEGSMLGGKMLGGGAGVSVENSLILMHRYIDMKSASIDALKIFAPYFIRFVEYWRFQLKAIIDNSFFVSGDFLKPKQLGLSKKFIKTSLECAKENLDFFAEELNLLIGFNEDYTCILGIDNKFSLHITYEPGQELLYLYAPLLDGLPVDANRQLALYEKLLTGSMLGGQMAGGGVGVSLKAGLILMHCNMDMRGAAKDVLKRLAPLFVEAVEIWRANCIIEMQSRDNDVTQQGQRNRLFDVSSVNRAYSLYDQYVSNKQDNIAVAINYLEQAITVVIGVGCEKEAVVETVINWQLELTYEYIQQANIHKARIAWQAANEYLIYLPPDHALRQSVQECLKKLPDDFTVSNPTLLDSGFFALSGALAAGGVNNFERAKVYLEKNNAQLALNYALKCEPSMAVSLLKIRIYIFLGDIEKAKMILTSLDANENYVMNEEEGREYNELKYLVSSEFLFR